MKKMFFLFVCCWQVNGFSQQSTLDMPESGNCPAGYCPGISIIIEQFNFHKPRTNCSKGFGLCFKIHVGASCIPCLKKPQINKKGIEVVGLLREKDMLLSIPKDIAEINGLSESDLNAFEIENQMIEIELPEGYVRYLKGGVYPVMNDNDSYSIEIPYE